MRVRGCVVGGEVKVEERFGFLQVSSASSALLDVAHELAENGLVEALALGLGVDLANVAIDLLSFLAKTHDALHEGSDLVLGYGLAHDSNSVVASIAATTSAPAKTANGNVGGVER